MNKQYVYEIIKKLLEKNGNKKAAALKLNCSIRSVDRYINIYKTKGKAGFVHGNKGNKPSIAFDDLTKNMIIDLYHNKYEGSNCRHFVELIKEREGIVVSDSSVRKWLLALDEVSPKAHRKTKRIVKQRIKARSKKKTTKRESNILNNKLVALEMKHAHPTRPRPKYMGERIEMDATPYRWFDGDDTMYHLHLAIDCATGKIVGAYMDYQETLNGYFNVLSQILRDYGIPYKFVTDKRTVFIYQQKKHPQDYEDTYTQFSRVCKQLGTELECTSIPQAKGRIERLNGTLQSRLKTEFKLEGITNIDDANKFLTSYVKKFNSSDFVLQLNDTLNIFGNQLKNNEINLQLSILSKRIINNGHAVRYKNNSYHPVDHNGNKQYFPSKTNVTMFETFKGALYIKIGNEFYLGEKIPQSELVSNEFENPVKTRILKTQRKIFIPGPNHPWRNFKIT